MAKPSTPTRTEPMNVGADSGSNILAAWQGIVNLFGGQGKFAYTPDGIVVNDFSVALPYDPSQIISDIGHRNRRLEFTEVYPWFNGETPAPFTDAKQITQWSVQFLRGSVEDNSSRTPKYVRDATSAYKTENNFAKKRGPKRKVFRVDNISELNEDVLAGVDHAELEKLQAALAAAMQRANSTAQETVTPEQETVTA